MDRRRRRKNGGGHGGGGGDDAREIRARMHSLAQSPPEVDMALSELMQGDVDEQHEHEQAEVGAEVARTPGTRTRGRISSPKRLSEVMDEPETPRTAAPSSSGGRDVLKSPPRRATRKQKRVQLTEVFEAEAEAESGVVPRRPPRRKRSADVRLESEPAQRSRTMTTKPKRSGKIGLSSTMETDHARCISAHKRAVQPPETSEEWREIQMGVVSPMELIGRRCKVYWPRDDKWYSGTVHDYRPGSKKHMIDYDDTQKEWINLMEHKVQFRMGLEEETRLIKSEGCTTKPDADELITLCHDLENEEELSPGSIVWAKVKGWPSWPAIVLDEELAVKCGLNTRRSSLPVQFFGSTEFSRLSPKMLMPFGEGVRQNLHTKSDRAAFEQAVREVERFLKDGKVPEKMGDSLDSWSRKRRAAQESTGDEGECSTKKRVPKCPVEIGGIRILSFGTIVTDSAKFHTKNYIWPLGYTAVRKFPSIHDPKSLVDYRMEVTRTPASPSVPTFCATPRNGETFEARSPKDCWKKIYAKLGATVECRREAGEFMFGFNIPRVVELILRLPKVSTCSKFTGCPYLPFELQWKHPERCNVCYVEEEYVDNLFLQCAKCRIMVHMACYGESEAPNGDLWLCQVCQQPERPACCLCPVTGGAMKRTTDDRWAHLTCATWIPETCLVDIKKMEPIGGVSAIVKKRWNLVCSLCHVQYGACIQCSHAQCTASYHPLCARAVGFRMEYREVGKAGRMCFFSFCQKHGPVTQGADAKPEESAPQQEVVAGCARCEPFRRTTRGRQEPEAQALALAKRLFVENTPYLVSGFRRSSSGWRLEKAGNAYKSVSEGTRRDRGDEPVLSLSARFDHMRASLHQRLTFGKSKIHGWGIFTKQEHQAGDIVAEYAGEILRPAVADLREKRHYDSIVGAGTYMFRIDDERVVDATRAGSIAHLINHSCEPNCHSRIITVEGEDHITICAKRDILAGEELTYDYRFTSKGEELNCNCGSRSCRGGVRRRSEDNDGGAICVPRKLLDDSTGLG